MSVWSDRYDALRLDAAGSVELLVALALITHQKDGNYQGFFLDGVQGPAFSDISLSELWAAGTILNEQHQLVMEVNFMSVIGPMVHLHKPNAPKPPAR